MNAMRARLECARTRASRWTWWMGLVFVLGCGEHGSSERTEEATSVGEVGTLSLPVVVTHAGITYRLLGSFSVRDTEDMTAAPLRVLQSGPEFGATVLRTTLPDGIYFVSLDDGWFLQAIGGNTGGRREIGMLSPNPQRVTISGSSQVNVVFEFSVGIQITLPQGVLSVGIEVREPEICGDGHVTQEEVCDDGLLNSSWNGCDARCRFVCVGACPLRVDPNTAVQHGSGDTFENPMRDLQEAIDQQGTLGGGEVWVRGGQVPLTSSDGKLLRMRDKVILRGGFRGSEWTAAERDADTYTDLVDTRQRGDESLSNADINLLTIADVRDVEVERLRLSGPGPLLRVKGGTNVLLHDMVLADYGSVRIDRSSVRIERSRFEPELGAVVVNGAKLAIVDSIFANDGANAPLQPGSVMTENSDLLFQRVRSDGPALIDRDSRALIIDTTFRSARLRAGYLEAHNTTIVGSQFVNDGLFSIAEYAPLSGSSLLVFNSSFIGLRVMLRTGGSYAAIHAIDAEIAGSTFFDNRCKRTTHNFCNIDIGGRAVRVHNTLFVHSTERQNPDDPPKRSLDELSIMEAKANCRTFEVEAFDVAPVGSGRVLARDYPCDDGGDEALLEAAHQRVLERAAPFLGAPFHADLTRYQSPDWWRSETLRANTCRDTEGPDPGRHFVRACMP